MAAVLAKTERRGRPVKSDSARQIRLEKFASMKASGVVVKRGRPAKVVDPNAPVVIKTPKVKKVKAVKTAKVKPVNDFVEQIISEGPNHKTVSHPTGKPVTYIRSKDTVQAAGKGFEDIAQEGELEIEDVIVDEFVPTEDDLLDLEA